MFRTTATARCFRSPLATSAAWLLASLVGALAAPPVAAQGGCPIAFGPPSTTPGPAPTEGTRLTTGDFNNDGLADLVYPSSAINPHGAVVFLRNSPFAFAAPVFNDTFNMPVGAKVTDLNQDGFTDLITFTDVHCAWHHGNGDGSFASREIIPFGGFVTAMAFADLNGDGFIDVTLATRTGVIRIRDGGPWPTSVLSHQFSYNPATFVDCAIGDFNADGRPDIAALGPGAVHIIPGTAAGTGLPNEAASSPDRFGAAVTFSAPADSRRLAVADLNSDGRDDIVVASATGSSLSVFFGRTGAGMAFPATPYAIAGHATDIAIADLNLDGKFDLIAACPAHGVICVLEGTGGNSFRPYRSFVAGPTPSSVCVGHADSADGYPDLLVMNQSPPGVSVLFNSAANPAIIAQPVTPSVSAGSVATFQVATTPGAALAFQWRRNGQPMSDDERTSGSTTGLLTLSPAEHADAGFAFDCIVSSPCGTVASLPVGIHITAGCTADFNVDGNLDPDDLGDFINAYFSGCP